MTDSVRIQWGRQYPNGTIIWEPLGDWSSVLETAEGRDAERAAYLKQFEGLNVVPTEDTQLVILQREVSTVTGSATVADTPAD